MRSNMTATESRENEQVSEWVYLESRPHAWKRELFLKGTRVRAGVIYSSMIANHLTREETAADWNLPPKAIDEIISYCEQNWPLIAEEVTRERRSAEAAGVCLEPPVASR